MEVAALLEQEPTAPTEEDIAREVAPTPLSGTEAGLANVSQGLLYPAVNDAEYYTEKPQSVQEEIRRIEGTISSDADRSKADEFEEKLSNYDSILLETPPNDNWFRRWVKDTRRKISERPKRRLVTLRNEDDVSAFFHKNNIEPTSKLPFNPSYISSQTSELCRFVKFSAPADVLKSAGLHNLNAEQLAQRGLVLHDLRIAQYAPRDLAVCFDTIQTLEAAGFTRDNFDARLWTLKAISKAYNKQRLEIANYFGMGIVQLLAAGVNPKNMVHYGVSCEQIINTDKAFNILLSLRLPLIELRNEYKFTQEAFFIGNQARFNKAQMMTLQNVCGWDRSDFQTVFEMDRTQIQKLSLGVSLHESPMLLQLSKKGALF